MAFRDKNNIMLFIGDIVEKDGQRFIVYGIATFPCATVAIAENIITKSVETLLLQDIIKI